MADLRSELKRIRSDLRKDQPTNKPQAILQREAARLPNGTPLQKSSVSVHIVRASAPSQSSPKSLGNFRPARRQLMLNPTAAQPQMLIEPIIVPVPTRFHSFPRSRLTRQSLFKIPEPWVADGGRAQCVSGGHSGAVDVFIGIDFGTSYTKAGQ